MAAAGGADYIFSQFCKCIKSNFRVFQYCYFHQDFLVNGMEVFGRQLSLTTVMAVDYEADTPTPAK